MFDQLDGLPLHPLVVHAVVVLAPLAALLSVAHLVSRWRRALRWPIAAIAVVATISAWVATQSGEALERAISSQLEGNPTGELVDEHARLGDRLFIALIVLSVVAVLVVAASRLDRAVVGHLLAVVLAVVAIGVGVLTYQVGDKGARAVWNPTGSVDYSRTN
ncbi:DUF2231 domain-containing protein [Solicola sp. PLA-1-18]|uniref:DUF2231 domain-containing protein n=1 Tax=Solicola sp. PLA-1-18 TaxID=3380532 RepID=UPI003B7ECD6F